MADHVEVVEEEGLQLVPVLVQHKEGILVS